MLLKEIKNIFHNELDPLYPTEEVNSFFYWLIEHYLHLERFVLAVEPQLTISKEDEKPFFEALAELRLERPIQYITGKAYFMDMELKVDENVLIPRPETEGLVRWVLENQKDDRRILDIGTGSGCIAIALAKNLPSTQLFALDISSNALKVARQNASDLGADIQFIEANISDFEGLGVPFDSIVSNPPYVREKEREQMRSNVTDYEPGLALFVSDEHPLKYYEAIASFAQENLRSGGNLYFEINQYLAEETEQLLVDHNFSEIQLRKDIFGNQRMVKCSKR